MQPKLIIHGGAGNTLEKEQILTATRDSLHRILDTVYRLLLDSADAVTAVVRGCQYLEDDPVFNAGTGAVLQADGQIRLSAGLMDGVSRSFSSVINVTDVQRIPSCWPRPCKLSRIVSWQIPVLSICCGNLDCRFIIH